MKSRIEKWMKKKNVPGLAACVVRGEEVTRSFGLGFADLTRQVPASPNDSLFHIASITKAITAVAIMKLYQERKLGLDDDINAFLGFEVRSPHWPDEPITFRHLLTHTASIKDHDATYGLYCAGDPKLSLEEIVTAYFSRSGDLWSRKNFRKKRPGDSEAYSNLGFALLGYLAERISDMPLEDYLRKSIFDPLGMNETSFYIGKLSADRLARPYTFAKRAKRELCPGDGDGNLLPAGVHPKPGFNEHALYSYPTLADGMIRTSAEQLARFLTAIMNGGAIGSARILEPETVAEMLPAKGRGLGWFRKKEFWGHDGSDPGSTSEMWFNRKTKTGFVILANTDTELDDILSLFKDMSEEGHSGHVS